MKSLIAFSQVLLEELGERCHTSTTRDRKTAAGRIEHEGLSFLTIVLPSFCQDLEKGLDQGYVDHDQFPGFARAGGLPRFLGGFLDLVFDRITGRLLDVPNVDAILALRQYCRMFAKVELPCSDARVRSAIHKYIQCEKDVREADKSLSASRKADFSRIAGLLWNRVFTAVDSDIYYGITLPKHGPGSTADGLKGNRKFEQTEWTRRLETLFPFGEYCVPNWRSFLERTTVDILEPGAERPVKVITVPKTLKTPRIIAVEPTCMMYVQQGILECLVKAIAADDIVASLIGFDDQEPNKLLAREGSRKGTLATLDLSEASDRVSNQHVRLLLERFPHFAEGVDACRSRKADVPGYGVIRLAKFASMGSALCFPFEAMVFLTVVFLGIEAGLNRRLTTKDIKSFKGQVRIYGDDIIIPVEFVELVVAALEDFGLKVNSNKSFWTGKFRESCGGDFYDGRCINIVRVRQDFPTQRKQTTEIISTVSLRNQLFLAGFVSSVEWLDTLVEGLLPSYPIVEATSQAIGRLSYSGYITERISHDLQKPLVKAGVATPRPRASQLDGWGALLKYFLKRSDLPFADREHLSFAGRPVSVDIKTRWVCPY